MRLTTRLRLVEAKLHPDDKKPRLLVVFEAADGNWRDGQNRVINQATLHPRTHVVVISTRPDGP